MNSNNEEPWITMNDFVEINNTGNNVEEKKEPEKKEPEKKEPTKKKSSMNYDKGVEEFFKAKKLYDDAYDRTKKKYLKNRKLTLDQKKAKIKAIKRKCVFCKGVGGMSFTNTEGFYRGRCMAAEPCNFNIDIKRGHYMLMPEILETLNDDKDNKMANIIALKLSLLFGLKDKEIVTQEFEAQKAEYKETVDSFNTVKTMLNQLNETKIEDEGVEKTIPTPVYISQLNTRLKEALNEFKLMIDEYNNPIGDEKSIIILQRAMELYIETIIPIQDNIRRAKYAVSMVDMDDSDNTYNLIQKHHTLSQLEINIPGHEGEVIKMQLR